MLFSQPTLLTSQGRAFTQNVKKKKKVSFHIFQVVASPKVIASHYPGLPTLAPIAEELHSVSGYSFISQPRCIDLGGSVAIYISDRINWIRRHDQYLNCNTYG